MRAVALLLLAAGRAAAWTHGWGSGAEMTWADFGYTLLTDAQAEFCVEKYKVVSLEKCTGQAQGMLTEKAIYQTAKQLKAKDPNVKVIFYLATDLGGFQCYAENKTLTEHPEWWLKDDKGAVVPGPKLDWTVPEAREWWVGIPLKGDGNGTFEGTPTADLIDGVLADGAGYGTIAGISDARREVLSDAKAAGIGEMQRVMTAANGGVVMANGISMYASQEDPRNTSTEDHLSLLKHTDAILNEHTAVFEAVNPNGTLNIPLVSRNLDDIVAAAANRSKSVFVSTWPGLYTGFKNGNPAYPAGVTTPQSKDEWRDALRAHFPFAYAVFLSVAEVNTWFFYGGVWYELHQGYVTCPEAPESCMAPPEWYPQLQQSLGAPKGPREPQGYGKWTREFEHASVSVDLVAPNASFVKFH